MILASTSASLPLNVTMEEIPPQYAGFLYCASVALHFSSYFDFIKTREEYIPERKMTKQRSVPTWID